MGGFIYGLAVALLLFEGIIIQCEGGGSSSNQRQDYLSIDTKEQQILLPREKIESIVAEFASNDPKIIDQIGKILQHHIVLITPNPLPFVEIVSEVYYRGDLFLNFGNYEKLKSFLGKFGDKVKKIEYRRWSIQDADTLEYINTNIIKNYSNNLEELRIDAFDVEECLQEISKLKLKFPKLIKVQLDGIIEKNQLKLNSIFPQLKCLDLRQSRGDVNLWADVKELTELTLPGQSIQEIQLRRIFENNPDMETISLYRPETLGTMKLISTCLPKLKTLKVLDPGEDFLLLKNTFILREDSSDPNQWTHELPLVENLDITFEEMNFKRPSFIVPLLKKLTFNGNQTDDQIPTFINNFEKLDKVELFVHKCNTLKCIAELRHIKECTAYFNENEENIMQRMSKIFDNKFKLQIFNLIVKCDDSQPQQKNVDSIKRKFKEYLKNGRGKPKWTLSSVEENVRTSEISLVFTRNP